MATKFYFHDAASAVGGTLPSAWLSTNYGPPSGTTGVTGTGAATNRTANTTIGVSQTSSALTTLAQTGIQHNWFRRFLSAPLAAQTIAAQILNISMGASESNAFSNMFPIVLVFHWRPSTGAKITDIFDISWPGGTEPGTSQSSYTTTAVANTTSATVLDGDILVFDLCATNSQSNGTARTNTQFYDGTTEGSTSSNAAFINFANTITFATAAATPFNRNMRIPQQLAH